MISEIKAFRTDDGFLFVSEFEATKHDMYLIIVKYFDKGDKGVWISS